MRSFYHKDGTPVVSQFEALYRRSRQQHALSKLDIDPHLVASSSQGIQSRTHYSPKSIEQKIVAKENVASSEDASDTESEIAAQELTQRIQRPDPGRRRWRRHRSTKYNRIEKANLADLHGISNPQGKQFQGWARRQGKRGSILHTDSSSHDEGSSTGATLQHPSFFVSKPPDYPTAKQIVLEACLGTQPDAADQAISGTYGWASSWLAHQEKLCEERNLEQLGEEQEEQQGENEAFAFHHIISKGNMEFLWCLGLEYRPVMILLAELCWRWHSQNSISASASSGSYFVESPDLKSATMAQLKVVTTPLEAGTVDSIVSWRLVPSEAVAWSNWNLFIGPLPSLRCDDSGGFMEQQRPLSFPSSLWEAIQNVDQQIEACYVHRQSISRSGKQRLVRRYQNIIATTGSVKEDWMKKELHQFASETNSQCSDISDRKPSSDLASSGGGPHSSPLVSLKAKGLKDFVGKKHVSRLNKRHGRRWYRRHGDVQGSEDYSSEASRWMTPEDASVDESGSISTSRASNRDKDHADSRTKLNRMGSPLEPSDSDSGHASRDPVVDPLCDPYRPRAANRRYKEALNSLTRALETLSRLELPTPYLQFSLHGPCRVLTVSEIVRHGSFHMTTDSDWTYCTSPPSQLSESSTMYYKLRRSNEDEAEQISLLGPPSISTPNPNSV